MKKYTVRMKVTKEYIFTLPAEDFDDAWENAKESFDLNDAEEIFSKKDIINIEEQK